MASASYQTRRDEIETYFDRTAADAWAALTSEAPVSRIRRTVRRGRDAMRETLMRWLPEDLTGSTLIDAGCGTGTLAIEAAQRGAVVVAIDLSPTLVNLARERLRDLNRAHAALDGLSISGDHCVPWLHYHPQIERLSFGPPQVATALKFMDSAHWVRFLLALTCWVFMRPHGLDGGQVDP